MNFAGDYTGTLSVSAASGTIPAWMGTPTIDYVAKTVTWGPVTPASGDVATDNFTPQLIDSATQTAVGPAQSVVVSAAASGASIVQTVVAPDPTHVALVFSTANGWAAPTVGNVLYLQVPYNGTGYSPGAGWNVVGSPPNTARKVLAWWRLATGSDATITLPSAYAMRIASLQELSGVDSVSPIHMTGVAADNQSNPGVTNTLTPTTPNTLAIAGASWNYSSTGFTVSESAEWTEDGEDTSVQYYSLATASQLQGASLTAVSCTFTASVSAQTFGATLTLFKPA